MKMTISSSVGSIQKMVLAAPPPVVLAGGADQARRHLVDRDGKAEAETDTGEPRLPERAQRNRAQVAAAGKMVAPHEVDRARPEHPRAVQRASV